MMTITLYRKCNQSTEKDFPADTTMRELIVSDIDGTGAVRTRELCRNLRFLSRLTVGGT